MQAKKRKYAPTDARRPDMSAQACGVLALIDQVASDLRTAGIIIPEIDLVWAVADACGSTQIPSSPLHVATRAIEAHVLATLTGVQRLHADTIATYLPSLNLPSDSPDIGIHPKAAVDALKQAGVPSSRLHTTENPVGVAVRTLQDLASAHEAWGMVNREDWASVYAAEGADGPFRTWVERHSDTLGEEAAEALSWGLIRLESQRHYGLVWKIIHRMSGSYPGHSAHDMFGWGWYGLTQAIRSYDPTTAAFSTYAARRINGAIRDGIRSEHHLPKRLTSVVREIATAEEDLVADLGRSPSLEELAAHVGATLAELELARTRYQVPASIEELMGAPTPEADESSSEVWAPESFDDPAEEAISSVQALAVLEALDRLPTEERQAVRMLILEEMSTTEAAEATGMTPRQLRRARQKGIESIAEDLKSWAG